jgi:phage terminase large subunit
MTTIKLNKAFKAAKKTNARYRVIYGGAGSGKSHYIAQETLLNMLTDKEHNYLVVRKTGKSIRNSVFRLLAQLISDYNIADYFTVNKSDMTVTCKNGASLITSGLDDVEKLKSVAGINRIWIEEASEVSEADFTQLDLRLRGQCKLGYQMTLSFNPISELHWIKKTFFDVGKDDSFILKTTYKDNPFLDDKYIKTLQDLEKQDYQYYRIYALGEWGSLGNLVYSRWRKEDLSQQRKIFDNFFNGQDFGFAEDPTAFIRLHYDGKKKEIYITDEVYQQSMHIDELAETIRPIVKYELVTCDSSEPRSISELQRHGIRAKGAKKGPGSVEHGIRWLQGHDIIVDERCTNFIKEISSYKWREDKDGNIIPKPVDMNNHLLDALRYALEDEMTNRKVTTKANRLV